MLIFTLLAGFFIVPTRTMPDNALVLLDDHNHTYVSPSCAKREKKEYREARLSEARKLNYEPDKNCRETGGFSQNNRSLTGNFMARLGMLPPCPAAGTPTAPGIGELV